MGKRKRRKNDKSEKNEKENVEAIKPKTVWKSSENVVKQRTGEKKRGRRMVMKSKQFLDDDGFMVKKKENTEDIAMNVTNEVDEEEDCGKKFTEIKGRKGKD